MNVYGKIIRICLRNKVALIWMFLFPIVLSTLFYFAFGSLDEEGKLEKIPVTVVKEEMESVPGFEEMLRALSEGEEAVLDVREVKSVKEADAQLKEGKTDGYIYIRNGKPALAVRERGMNQTILKSILDQYVQTAKAGETAVSKGTGNTLIQTQEGGSGVKQVSLSENPPSESVNYFYTLLAMVCLYAGFLGNVMVELRQANLSAIGARRCMAPCRPLGMLAVDFLAYLTVSYLSVCMAVLYIGAVLKISFGGKWLFVLLACLMGTIVGLLFGAAVSMSSKIGSAGKTGIIVSISMACCFMAGMMIGGINYKIEQYAPVLSWINPAARIADAFYCLYYYDSYGRYFQSIGALGIMAAVLLVILLIFERRQRYESI